MGRGATAAEFAKPLASCLGFSLPTNSLGETLGCLQVPYVQLEDWLLQLSSLWGPSHRTFLSNASGKKPSVSFSCQLSSLPPSSYQLPASAEKKKKICRLFHCSQHTGLNFVAGDLRRDGLLLRASHGCTATRQFLACLWHGAPEEQSPHLPTYFCLLYRISR